MQCRHNFFSHLTSVRKINEKIKSTSDFCSRMINDGLHFVTVIAFCLLFVQVALLI